MVDWHSPTRLARDARVSVSYLLETRLVYNNPEAFSNLVHVCLGIYL